MNFEPFKINFNNYRENSEENIILTYNDNGDIKKVSSINNCHFKFRDNGNSILVYENNKFLDCSFNCGKKSKIIIKKSKYLIKQLNVQMIPSGSCSVFIDEDFSLQGAYFKLKEGTFIRIGRDCMFSFDIFLWSTDSHAIIDLNSNLCINQGGSITIGNHVWLGHGVELLKKTQIGDNSVVGSKSLCNKVFTESNVILAGNPARVIKHNINWHRESPSKFKVNHVNAESVKRE